MDAFYPLGKIFEFYRIQQNITNCMYIIGLVGNFLMFVVYSQSRMRKLSVSIYFQCMALVASSYIVFNYFLILDWKNYCLQIEYFLQASSLHFSLVHADFSLARGGR